MRISFTGRHYEVDDQVRGYAEAKLEKLKKHLDEPVDVQLILEVEKRRQIAEIHLSHRHGSLQATEEADEMRDAIHAVVDKAKKQARRGRKKHKGQKRRGRVPQPWPEWPLDVVEAASVSAGVTPRVIEKTTLAIKPMTIDEAALELDRSSFGFFVFRDSATERVNVIYRRKDGNYGLIAPEF